MDGFIDAIDQTLLPTLAIESLIPCDPVIAHHVPPPWQLLGAGNYAVVVVHPDYPEQVVKVYAPGRPGLLEEAEVYRRLGIHPAFSQCFYVGANFLVLKRIRGITLYDSLNRGVPIPPQVIEDIDWALAYARSRGLCPHDVHGRNVMMQHGRGVVVDVSDFLHDETCSAWRDLKRAYHWLYRPLFSPLRVRVPYWMLDVVRVSYRLWRRLPRWRRLPQ